MRKARRAFIMILLVGMSAALTWAAPATGDSAAPPQPARRVKVLFLGDDGHHVPLERCRQVYSLLGQHHIDLTYTDHLADLNPATLGRYDVLLLYANWERIAPEQQSALIDYVESGHGFAVIHCGSYCFLNSPKITAMIGGRFKSHQNRHVQGNHRRSESSDRKRFEADRKLGRNLRSRDAQRKGPHGPFVSNRGRS